MKKVLFLALAAAAVMSCSESEEIENAGQKAEIKLGTVVGNTTRATVTDLPELQKVGFTVYAYNTGATTMASVATFDAMKEFMAAVKVTYSAPDWSLTGGTYYWPMTDNLQFFAYGNPGTGGEGCFLGRRLRFCFKDGSLSPFGKAAGLGNGTESIC